MRCSSHDLFGPYMDISRFTIHDSPEGIGASLPPPGAPSSRMGTVVCITRARASLTTDRHATPTVHLVAAGSHCPGVLLWIAAEDQLDYRSSSAISERPLLLTERLRNSGVRTLLLFRVNMLRPHPGRMDPSTGILTHMSISASSAGTYPLSEHGGRCVL